MNPVRGIRLQPNARNVWHAIANWLGKFYAKRPPRRLRVAESLAIGEKRQLLIIECGDRRLLIGAAANFLATLAELDGVQGKQRPCA